MMPPGDGAVLAPQQLQQLQQQQQLERAAQQRRAQMQAQQMQAQQMQMRGGGPPGPLPNPNMTGTAVAAGGPLPQGGAAAPQQQHHRNSNLPPHSNPNQQQPMPHAGAPHHAQQGEPGPAGVAGRAPGAPPGTGGPHQQASAAPHNQHSQHSQQPGGQQPLLQSPSAMARQQRFDSGDFIDPAKAAALLARLGLRGKIKPFGSYTSGLITKNSDLDVMYERASEEQDLTPVQILQKFHDGLQKLGTTTEAMLGWSFLCCCSCTGAARGFFFFPLMHTFGRPRKR